MIRIRCLPFADFSNVLIREAEHCITIGKSERKDYGKVIFDALFGLNDNDNNALSKNIISFVRFTINLTVIN